ncbi:CASP-like protein [Rhynchospora pubera]|uniref:CASP-like protein n=1 Tax=Rhynchospora pubera TaxID=906938 RepID=A0AAV8BVX7_9POAL|nr:CASP-like protein [Rhynchospora pubera]
MASSPPRSPTGETPQPPTPRSPPQSFHSPLQSPSHEPASSGNHFIPPSSPVNNTNNTNSLLQSPTDEGLPSPIQKSPNHFQSSIPSPSHGPVSSGNHSIPPPSPLGNNNSNRSPHLSPSPHHLSISLSPSNNNRQENHKETQLNHKPILSPKLYPLHLRSSKQSFQVQPPSLHSLSESEPSPSSLAVISNPVNETNKQVNYDEEAIDSPLRTVNLDRSNGPRRVSGSGGGNNYVVAETVWRAEVRRAAVALRVLAAVLCMVSFSVMAADRTEGWDGDSYRLHEEYQYVLTVNVITFVYSSIQLFLEIHRVITMRHAIPRPLSYYIDLIMDQILAYLLMSASSVAASHNDIWSSRFGGDEFTKKINGSVVVSFVAFIAVALSSVISTYVLFRWLA